MNSVRTMLCLSLGFVSLGLGCNKAIELQTINKFNLALEEGNIETLKETSSDRFEHRALRLDASVDDFKVLRLPKGEAVVVEDGIEDISENEKHVQVEVGESKRKLQYRLKRNPETEEWVVDEIHVKQRQRGLESVKPVTEQMDLLLSVREFLTKWERGRKAEMLAMTTPEMREQLEKLPDAYLQKLTKQVIGKRAIDSKHKPEAHMDKDVAIVKLNRSSGVMLLSFKLQNNKWKVSDVAVEDKDGKNNIPSLRKSATVVLAGIDFLNAYQSKNKNNLKKVTTKKLYENSIMPAQLHKLPLPTAAVLSEKAEIKTHLEHAELMLPSETAVTKVTFSKVENEKNPNEPPKYLVDDVTIYELNTNQQIRMSSFFTSQAIVQLFHETMANGDLNLIRMMATPDFRAKVWQRLTPQQFRGLPFGDVQRSSIQLVKTDFQGQVTRITARQGTQEITYLLRTWDGKVLVDDIIVPKPHRPDSLKDTYDVLLPVQEFLAGLQTNQIEKLQRVSAPDFNRTIWAHTTSVPPLGKNAISFLSLPLGTLTLQPTTAVVSLGNFQRGAKVTLMKHRDVWAIEEIELIAGTQANQRVALTKGLREQIVRHGGHLQNPIRFSNPQQRPVPRVSPVGHHQPQGTPGAVTPAHHSTINPNTGQQPMVPQGKGRWLPGAHSPTIPPVQDNAPHPSAHFNGVSNSHYQMNANQTHRESFQHPIDPVEVPPQPYTGGLPSSGQNTSPGTNSDRRVIGAPIPGVISGPARRTTPTQEAFPALSIP